MKPFKIGQAVYVKGAFVNGGDGVGIVVGKSNNHPGWLLIKLGETNLPVDPARLQDAEEYFKKQREEFIENNPKYKIKW